MVIIYNFMIFKMGYAVDFKLHQWFENFQLNFFKNIVNTNLSFHKEKILN